MEIVKKIDDSIFIPIFSLTTIAVVFSLLLTVVVYVLYPSANQKSKSGLFTQSQETQAGNSQINPKETWKFGGYALGKNAGNEDAFSVFMAEVVKTEDGRYRMYYGWAGQGGTGIKSAVSTDAKTWTVEEGFRLKGAGSESDREYVISGPSIVKLPDGRLRMYYQSGPQSSPNEAPKFHVRSAISSDGLNFTREGVRIDISPYTQKTGLTFAGHGTYYRANDGTYVGIFSGNLGDASKPSDLVMATSKDGLTFSNFKALYKSWHDPIVLKTKDGFVLYATYLVERQGLAKSSDGLSWDKEPTSISFVDESGNRLTEGDSGVGDLGGVVLPDEGIRIYANFGNPSTDIVYFERK